MITEFKIFEYIEWYSKGEFTEEPEDKSLDIEPGDRVRMVDNKNVFWEGGIFRNSNRGIGETFKITEIGEKGGFPCVFEPNNGWYKLECVVKSESWTNEGISWWKDGQLGEEEDDPTPEYNDFITNDEFRQFLINNDIYDIYIKYAHCGKNWDKYWKKDPNDIINSTLSWGSTPSPKHPSTWAPWPGRDSGSFWHNMDSEWRNIAEMF